MPLVVVAGDGSVPRAWAPMPRAVVAAARSGAVAISVGAVGGAIGVVGAIGCVAAGLSTAQVVGLVGPWRRIGGGSAVGAAGTPSIVLCGVGGEAAGTGRMMRASGCDCDCEDGAGVVPSSLAGWVGGAVGSGDGGGDAG